MERRRGIECIQQDQKMGQSSFTYLTYLYLSVISRMEIPIIESEIPYPSHATRNTEHGTRNTALPQLLPQIPNLHKLC